LSLEELVTGPGVTLAGGIGAVILAQLSYWARARRNARARQTAEVVGIERVRLGNEETANERLFRNINDRLQLCERRYAESDRHKQELESRVNTLAGTVIRLSAALDIMRAAYASAGLKEPKLPLLEEE
jgi:hypothetical protein